MKSKFRSLLSAASHNDGTRTLEQSIMVPQLVAALRDWATAVAGGVLIGGLAYSMHGRPRQTMDIDVLFLHAAEIPSHVQGFRRIRPHTFRHDGTHVEVEVVDPASINMSEQLAHWVQSGSVSDFSLGVLVKVTSPSGVIASKLGRWSLRDQADVDELLDNFVIDVSDAPLSTVERERFAKLLASK